MMQLDKYKEHLINSYSWDIDNTDEKRLKRKELLDTKYGDKELQKIIDDTYLFAIDVINSDTFEKGYCRFEICDDTTDHIDLDLRGGWNSDTIFIDSKNRRISNYIFHYIFGACIDIDYEEVEYGGEDDIVGVDNYCYLYMQGFSNNIEEIKQKVMVK